RSEPPIGVSLISSMARATYRAPGEGSSWLLLQRCVKRGVPAADPQEELPVARGFLELLRAGIDDPIRLDDPVPGLDPGAIGRRSGGHVRDHGDLLGRQA